MYIEISSGEILMIASSWFLQKKTPKKQSVGEENIFSFLKCDSNYECSYSIHSL